MTVDFMLPHWDPPDHEQRAISDDAYFAWLSEERSWLITERQLERLQADIARCPVDARFTL